MSASACAPRALSQTLRVYAVGDDRLWLEADRAAACAVCAARAGCGAGALAGLLQDAPQLIVLPRSHDVCRDVYPGDEVVVSIPAGTFLGAVGRAYLVPPLALVLGVALLSWLGLPQLLVAGLSLPLLALSLWPLRWAERRGDLLSRLTIDTVLPRGAG